MDVNGSRLAASWHYWSVAAGLTNPIVTQDSNPRTFHFRADQYAFHLRAYDSWWIVDTEDDRNQFHADTAKFATCELAEKYLVWQWSSTARIAQRQPPLGPNFYTQGMATDVTAGPISEGIYTLSTPEGKAVLMEPTATIFSHLMRWSLDEIEKFAKTGFVDRAH